MCTAARRPANSASLSLSLSLCGCAGANGAILAEAVLDGGDDVDVHYFGSWGVSHGRGEGEVKGEGGHIQGVLSIRIGSIDRGNFELEEIEVFARGNWEGADSNQCLKGRLDEGVCVCDPDYFGKRCELGMLLADVHLPSRHDISSSGSDSLLFHDGFQEALSALESVQNTGGKACGDGGDVSFFFENRGMASTLMHISGLLTFAFKEGSTLALSRR